MRAARAYVVRLLLGTIFIAFLLSLTPLAIKTLILSLPNSETGQELFILVWSDLAESPDLLYHKGLMLILGLSLIALYSVMACWIRTQSDHRQWYRLITAMWLICVTIGAIHLIGRNVGPRFIQCDAITQMLNGGAQEFGDTKFQIELCGSDLDAFNYRKIRMRIFDEDRRLLTTRYFMADWDNASPRGLQYSSDRIIFFDAAAPEDYKKTLLMPPTWWDQSIARLPVFD